MHPDFVKELHARLVEGVGVFRKEPENDDVPAKITFSRGVQKSHAERHVLKMVSLWRGDFDTMKFLDWRAMVIDSVGEKVGGMSKVQQKYHFSEMMHFEGYVKQFLELQISIFLHFPGLVRHLQAVLKQLYQEHSVAGRKRVLGEIPVAENGKCGDAGKTLLAEFAMLNSHAYDFTVFQQLANQDILLPSTPEEWQKVNLCSSILVPLPVRKAWSGLMTKIELLVAELDLQAIADAKAAAKKQEVAEANKKGLSGMGGG